MAKLEPEDLVGASMLIGLTFIQNDGSERYESFIGRVMEYKASDTAFENLDDQADSPVFIIECHDGELRTYPFDNEAIGIAEPGFYELPDGATIENPDYEMHWRVTAPTKN